jgi:Domain of unknown function (DUF4336)
MRTDFHTNVLKNMLQEIDSDLWTAEQPFYYLGLGVGTRMTVIRLVNRELVVISPIQVNEETLYQLDQLGAVRHIIAPNLYHHLFVSKFKEIYPNAILWAAPELSAKRPDLSIDREIKGAGGSLWTGLEYLLFEGFRTLSLNGFDDLNECVFLHRASRTLILTDTAFHFDETFPLVTQLTTRVLGGYKKLSPSILERIASRDKDQVRQSVKNVLAWDFERVIMAHGRMIESNGKQQFADGYRNFF